MERVLILDDAVRHAPGAVDFGDLIAERLGGNGKNGGLLSLKWDCWTAQARGPIVI